MERDQCWPPAASLPPDPHHPVLSAEQFLGVHVARPEEGDRGLVRQLGQVGAGEVTLAAMVTWT